MLVSMTPTCFKLAKYFIVRRSKSAQSCADASENLDRDVRVEIPEVDGVCDQFNAPRDARELAPDQECAVAEQVSSLPPSPSSKVTTSASSSCSGS